MRTRNGGKAKTGRNGPKPVLPSLPRNVASIQLIGDKEAAKILFDTVAERFVDRPGGYTRIMRLATPRLGDAGERAILEFVGKNDRVKRKAQKPAFEAEAPKPADPPKAETPKSEAPAAEPETAETAAAESDAEKT